MWLSYTFRESVSSYSHLTPVHLVSCIIYYDLSASLVYKTPDVSLYYNWTFLLQLQPGIGPVPPTTDVVFVSKTRVRCPVPRLMVRDSVQLSLSLDNGQSYPYSTNIHIGRSTCTLVYIDVYAYKTAFGTDRSGLNSESVLITRLLNTIKQDVWENM